MAKGKRKFNEFNWINVVTPELEHSASFFQSVLGWTYADGVPGGRLILVDGQPAGALMDQAHFPSGSAAEIGVMIKVQSADAAVDRINASGGSAKPAFDVMQNGRMAMCTDPNGAVFAVWQPLSKDGAQCDSHAPGAPTWFELLTSDPERAVAFYTQAFGWKAVTDQPAPGMTYTIFQNDGVGIAGAMRFLPDQLGKIPPHWGTYFTVKDTDETVRRAQELGAELCVPPHDIPKVGRFALMKSPQGVPFHVMQYAPQQ